MQKRVRPRIGNWEINQAKHWKYPKKLGKQYVKYEETYEKMGESM